MYPSKRILDLTIAVPALILATPIICLAAVAIYLDSPGNPFFSQIRVGRSAHHFRLFKLRTLYSNVQIVPNPEDEIRPGDSRITGIGRYLRQSKLDELPQLLNIVLGQMSIVGPRPDVPEQVAMYSGQERNRISIRPGLTGLAQISGNTWLSWNERSKIDNYYIEHSSFSVDMRIIWYTLKMLLFGERPNDDPFAIRRSLSIPPSLSHRQNSMTIPSANPQGAAARDREGSHASGLLN